MMMIMAVKLKIIINWFLMIMVTCRSFHVAHSSQSLHTYMTTKIGLIWGMIDFGF